MGETNIVNESEINQTPTDDEWEARWYIEWTVDELQKTVVKQNKQISTILFFEMSM